MTPYPRSKLSHATIYDIAQEAGVSIATVSRAINSRTRHQVSAGTLQRIEAVIGRHHYSPNLAAKGLVSGGYKTIGILMPHIPRFFQSPYFSKILSGVSEALLESDYRMKIVSLKPYRSDWDGLSWKDFHPGNWDRYPFRTAEGLDGLIATLWLTFFSHARALDRIDVPSVVINDPEPCSRVHFVRTDGERGGMLAAEHLYSLGHRHIAVFTGFKLSSDSRLRTLGFRRYLLKRGIAIPPDWIIRANYMPEIAYQEVGNLLAKTGRKVTAIYCCNDEMACGVIRRLKELKIRCPEDISVVGFDDLIPFPTKEGPALTTVHVPTEELGRTAAKVLLARLDRAASESFESRESVLPVELCVRGSTARRR